AVLGFYIGSITLGFLTGSFLASRLAPRYRLSTMMLAGRIMACTGLSLGLGLALIGIVSPLSFFGATVFVGLGNGITMPSSNAAAMSAMPRLAGTAAGLSGALTVGSGAALTSLAGIILTQNSTPETLLTLMLGASLAGLAAALWTRRLESIAGRADRSETVA
ncbi:MAG: Bcr/CflA family drug resistance efflux transporter, partial [Pseudomonadota bacterium]